MHGSAQEIARSELRRTCGRWGMLGDSEFVVLRSLKKGMDICRSLLESSAKDVSAKPDLTWRVDDGPMVPLHPIGSKEGETAETPWVNDQLVDMAGASFKAFLSRAAQGGYLQAVHRVDDAQEHVMRRAWMMCLEHDRRGLVMTARNGIRVVNIGIFKGIPSGELHARKNRSFVSSEAMEAARPSSSQTFWTVRQQNSVEWAGEDLARGHRLFGGDPLVKMEYERDVEARNLMPYRDFIRFVASEYGLPLA